MVKVGAILGIIGSTVFLIVGLYTILMSRLLYTGITNIVLGSLGIVGVFIAFRYINRAGYILLLVVGVAGIIFSYIPLYIWDDSGYLRFYYLCSTALYGDLFLMIIGGLLGFALGGKKERKDF
jgi:hypothetical protein